MGIPGKPKNVLLFVGTLFRDMSYYYDALKILENLYGETLFESSFKIWRYSSYYEPEMGSPLFRRFIFFKKLISEEDLASIKIKTNEIERKLSKNDKRNINLDPGYISLAKLVLATTKDYCHRIYIAHGIYGEVTLYFKRDSFQPHEFTYRDYADKEYIKIFNLARNLYRDLLFQNKDALEGFATK